MGPEQLDDEGTLKISLLKSFVIEMDKSK